ncbi:MAG: hypothetical protein RL033_6178 [Pseudomonadota bacterium]|jgi:hypothetical protein
MSTFSAKKSRSSLSVRGLRLAGAAAVVGCAACGLAPLLAAAGVGSGAVAAAFAAVFRPGSGLVAGGAVFIGTAGWLGLRHYVRRARSSGCVASRHAGESSCDGGIAPKRV